MGISRQEVRKASEYSLSEAEKDCFMPDEPLMNEESNEEWRDWLTAHGVSVQK